MYFVYVGVLLSHTSYLKLPYQYPLYITREDLIHCQFSHKNIINFSYGSPTLYVTCVACVAERQTYYSIQKLLLYVPYSIGVRIRQKYKYVQTYGLDLRTASEAGRRKRNVRPYPS